MYLGDEVVSRRHQGTIRIVIVYSNGGGVGRKIKKNGQPGRQEVCLRPDDVTAVRMCLLGCQAR
jgi:hypothetical protein